MKGYISLHRKILESEIFQKPPLYLKVWIFLLLSAQHSQYRGLMPGQVRTSIPEIIEACKWRVGARIEKPTKDQIYQVLEFLRGKGMKSERSLSESNAKATMITTTKATHGLLINICNYSLYQDLDEDESNAESNDEKPTKEARKQRQPDNINNNVNNDNNLYKEEDNAHARVNDPDLNLLEIERVQNNDRKPVSAKDLSQNGFSPVGGEESTGVSVKVSDNPNSNADDPPADTGLGWLSPEVENISTENDCVRVYDFYQSNFGMLSPYLSQQLGKWVDDMNGEIVILAMEQALKNNVRKVSYINSILNDWHSQGAKTLEQCQALINDFESRKGWGAHEKHQAGNKGVRHGGDSEESSGSKKEGPFAFLDERYKKRWEPPEFLQVSKVQGRGGFSDPL
ncbi:DnaD domain-containing protein [Paenibacillus aquistagni]|uniref:DnaD domain-containing protein n=1 Tax=Paenibacillus aquistagni TaxID=1852522 RepID=UPI001F0EF99C|nr:DnaD domain protein [Paenibacillus aquistagni]